MANTDLGKIGITVCGEFIVNTDYEIQTIITYGGASYISMAQTGEALPTDTTKWLKLCENGTIGSMWYSGTSITGTSSTPAVFSESGIENANPQDMYLNTSYSYVYQCVLGGNSNVATWKYLMTLTGGGSGGSSSWSDVVEKPFTNVGTNGLKITSDIVDVDFAKVQPIISKNTAFNKSFEATATNIKANGTQSVGTSDNIPRADHVHPLQTSVSGNAGTATKLANSRTITMTGDVSGSASFDGSANVSITTVVADDSHNHIIENVDGLQTALDEKQPLTNSLTEETEIADADTMSFYDASENENRKSTWANIVSKLKDYFDTVYNNYVLPTASPTVKGGVKIGSGLTMTGDVLSSSGGVVQWSSLA